MAFLALLDGRRVNGGVLLGVALILLVFGTLLYWTVAGYPTFGQ